MIQKLKTNLCIKIESSGSASPLVILHKLGQFSLRIYESQLPGTGSEE